MVTKDPNIFDIECFKTYFLIVFYNVRTKETKTFEIGEYKNEIKELREYCNTVSWFIGYNNKSYDCPMLEHALRGYNYTQLFELSTSIIKDKRIYKTNLNYIDLQLVNHYTKGPKATSLKKLAFTFRCRNVYDMPVRFDKPVPLPKIKPIVKYCADDVLHTVEVYEKTIEKLKMRKELSELFNVTLRNHPDPSMGEAIFCSVLGVDQYKLLEYYTQYESISFKDIIFDYIGSGQMVDTVRDFFNSIVLKPHKGLYKYSESKEKKYEYFYTDGDALIKFAFGGVHGVAPKGIYSSTDTHVIKTCDVTSEYPNCILNNGLYPILLGPKFIETYTWIKEQRPLYKKGTVLNSAFKLLLNLVYGKTNSEYSIFYDPKLMFTVTINCQLMMAWLADMLREIPDSRLLEINTDGISIFIPREHEGMYKEVCAKWESLTKFNLEFDTYSKIIIRDVNNYMAQFESGKIKRKGVFCTYDDIMAAGEYHKDTSHNIIPLALTKYYIDGKDPEETVREEQNIHEFLIGAKKSRTPKRGDFEWLLTKQEGPIDVHKKSENRLLRYYASNGGSTLCKLFEDGSLISVHADTRITVLEKIKKNYKITDFDINYDWYLGKIYDVIK